MGFAFALQSNSQKTGKEAVAFKREKPLRLGFDDFDTALPTQSGAASLRAEDLFFVQLGPKQKYKRGIAESFD